MVRLVNESTTRVSLLQCPSYGSGVQPCLQSLLQPLGGMDAFVKPGQTVLVKPNLLTDRTPDQAVTTHPDVLQAVLRLIKQAGARPRVADSPANVAKVERVWERSGLGAVCEQEGVPLLSLEKQGSASCTVDGMRFAVARAVLEADVIVNLPKVKTHVLTMLTAAVKNMYGTVPGFAKTTLHRNYPTARRFGNLLAAVYSKVPPALSIADAIVGMEGDGPSGGRPIELGFLAASADSVAMDLTLCDILGIEPRTVPYFAWLRKHEIGPADTASIQTVGASPDVLRPEHFRAPGTLRSRLIPGWLVTALKPLVWIRPSFNAQCVRCGLCTRACPMQAITVPVDGDLPVLNPSRCIGCCCCHEVCPHQAIDMTRSPLIRLLRGNNSP